MVSPATELDELAPPRPFARLPTLRSEDRTTIALLSDLHFTTVDRGTSKQLHRAVDHARTALAAVEAERPDAAVLLGDLVHRGRTADFDRFDDLLAELSVPVYGVPGNHDVARTGPGTLSRSAFETRYAPDGLPLAVDVNDVSLFGLGVDANRVEDQLDALSRRSFRPDGTVLCFHRPLSESVAALERRRETHGGAFPLEDPRNPYTRALLSAIPEPDPTAEFNRIPLRGSTPNPRHPPDGCPFATRCPMKIRPAEYDLPDEAWTAIDAFYGVLRQRAHRDVSLAARARRLLGAADAKDVEEAYRDAVRERELPDDVDDQLRAAIERYRTEGPEAAASHLEATFGSVCDDDPPDPHEGASISRCHRHRDGYAPPDEVDSR